MVNTQPEYYSLFLSVNINKYGEDPHIYFWNQDFGMHDKTNIMTLLSICRCLYPIAACIAHEHSAVYCIKQNIPNELKE